MTLKTLQTLMMAAVLLMPATAFAQKSNSPQLVQNIDDAVRNAVSFMLSCTPPANNPNPYCATDYTVPAGYRLAITQVNLQIVQAPPPGVDPPWLALHGRLNGAWVMHAFPATRAAGRWMGTTNAFFVVDDVPSGASVILGANGTQGYVVISGYLVRM
jgi:hypothetical protein